MSADVGDTPLPRSKRRRFRIQSDFGRARQWRSRKSRPCDACRRRKTACVIDTEPPCGYCRSKGIPCRATTPLHLPEPLTPSPVPEEDSSVTSLNVLSSAANSASLPLSSSDPHIPASSSDEAPTPQDALQVAPLPVPWPASALPPQGGEVRIDKTYTATPMAAAVDPDVSSTVAAPLNLGRREQPAFGGFADDMSARVPFHETVPIFPVALTTTATATATTTATRVPHVDRTATITLEDNPNRTAHVMGLAAEQDAELLVSFRSAVRNELNRVDADIVQVYGGDVRSNQLPVHFSLLHDEFAPMDNVAKQAASDHIETAVRGCADELVRLYFAHVHPVYPVLAKTRFLRTYTADKASLPASLRGVVYGLAANFWRRGPRPPHQQQQQQQQQRPRSVSTGGGGAHTHTHVELVSTTPPTPPAVGSAAEAEAPAAGSRTNRRLPFDHHTLFEDALASLQRELHGPDLWTLQACLLLLHENSAENATMETPRVWTLTAQAVACAQMNGLHRDPSLWNLPPWEKRLRRKLWWATVAADTWSALCHGNPPHVYGASFTTTDVTMEDVAPDEDVPVLLQHFLSGRWGPEDEDGETDHRDAHYARRRSGSRVATADIAACARFTTMISLSCIVHELLLSSFSDVAYTESMKDPVARETMLLGFRQKLRNWASLLPRCLAMDGAQTSDDYSENNAPVHLAFYAAIALTYRALMSPVTKAAKQDADSRLRRYFSAAVDEFAPFIEFMHGISAESLHAFWGVHARSQLIICGNFLIYLFLLAPSAAEIQESFQVLSRFHDALRRLSAMADNIAIDLLRPVALRIDTFFTQSAQTMYASQNANLGLS
ncbi:fungal specific transcription factor domain-containing protein [Niveomyces insectorum RCEF 264]|uniref:Fungal specific transcription factor domain-containing protein n=1 Tax=Niveomyces insectorum RCEF 264 TaxID=1081102 RepID=A0A167NQ30_9HYPO|nr:fungal specific transcription factor domain-containing protein [Niveomyces insectorum RCEF 264]